MTTKRKQTAAPKEPPKQALKSPTAMHFTYSPEAGLVRVNVQQDATLLGIRQRHGRDQDCLLKELPAKVRTALEKAHELVASEVGAKPFKAAK